MKKQYILLGICVLVLAALTGALLLLNASPDTDTDTGPDSGSSVTATLDETAVYITGGDDEPPPDAIEVTNESGTYSMLKVQENGQDELRIPELDGASQDIYALDTAGESARAMKAKVIAENVTDAELKDFGLDNPRATAKIFHLEKSSPVTVFFGDNAPGGEGIYAKRFGDKTVYLVDSVAAEPFFKPMLAYVSTSVTATDPDAMGLDRVVISGSEIPEPIIIEKLESNDDESFSFGTHRILSPVSAELDFTARQALISLYGLTATNAVAVGDDSEALERYGLAEPSLTAAVTGPAGNPEMSFTLRVSAPDENGNLHVIKNGSKIIYEIPEAVMPWTKLKLFDYMDKTVLMPDIDDVSDIVIALGDKRHTFVLSEGNDGLTVSLDGKSIDTSEFRTFYQNLTAAEYDAPTDEIIEPDVVPVAEIRYTYKRQNRMDIVSFYPGPLRRNIVSLNGGTPYLCVASYLINLESDLDLLLSGAGV